MGINKQFGREQTIYYNYCVSMLPYLSSHIPLNLWIKNLAQMYPTVPPTKHPNTTPAYIPISPHPNMKQNM